MAAGVPRGAALGARRPADRAGAARCSELAAGLGREPASWPWARAESRRRSRGQPGGCGGEHLAGVVRDGRAVADDEPVEAMVEHGIHTLPRRRPIVEAGPTNHTAESHAVVKAH